MPQSSPTSIPTSGGTWAMAVIVIAISLLSTFTLSRPGASTSLASNGGTGRTSTGFTTSRNAVTGLAGTRQGNSSTGKSGGGVIRRTQVVQPGTPGSPGQSPSQGITDPGGSSPSGTPNGPTATTPGPDAPAPVNTPGPVTPSSPTPPGPQTVNGQTYDCSQNQNAGATDKGVSGSEIKFAATVVQTGVAKDFLADAQYGMEAIRQKVNRAGGICGRQITIKYDDDGWDEAKGQQIIEADIGSGQYFGLAVNPSSEGLRGAVDSKDIDNAQFPVVGADGMLIDQYRDPWVWPVATSTHSVMHIIAKDAYQRGARTFGIVWDQNYEFGPEGHQAFLGEMQRLGAHLAGADADQPVQGGQSDYTNQAAKFMGACGSDFHKCDFVALLLDPATAAQWVRNGGLGNGSAHPHVGIGAPQPLFVNDFAKANCGAQCSNLEVWTSFKPPIPPFDSEQAVATYASDVRNVSSTADVNNPHVEGAYVGMELLVAALQQLGPAPTRAGLQQALDSMTFDSGLGDQGGLTFQSGNHFAATSAQGFNAVYNVNSFVGWRYANTGFVADDALNQDMPS